MIVYFTYAEPPSGVYSSQVCDVVNYLSDTHQAKIKLVAFISIKGFNEAKKKIKSQCATAFVFPMLPKATYWRLNIIWLWLACLFLRPHTIIARNVIACNMALAIKKTRLTKEVCFDGRGAIAAEWKEYEVKVVEQWKKEIDDLERNAVIKSDFRIAVSAQLVNYWITVYHYAQHNHVIIPCTLSTDFMSFIDEKNIFQKRAELGFKEDDIVFAYSGSAAGWQSFALLEDFLNPVLSNYPSHKIIFLAPQDDYIDQLKIKYPDQVQQKWLKHQEVKAMLQACDYGILIREQTLTNKVASPTKFAEYLSSGLPVIISENLGDYTNFVEKEKCGFILRNNTERTLFIKPTFSDKQRMTELVKTHFTKQAQSANYKLLLKSVSRT